MSEKVKADTATGIPLGRMEEAQSDALDKVMDEIAAVMKTRAAEWRNEYGYAWSVNMLVELNVRLLSGFVVGLGYTREGTENAGVLLGARIGQYMAQLLDDKYGERKAAPAAFVSNEVGHA